MSIYLPPLTSHKQVSGVGIIIVSVFVVTETELFWDEGIGSPFQLKPSAFHLKQEASQQ